ncbi:MAG: glycosyltransferase [Gemmataceae bacterium]
MRVAFLTQNARAGDAIGRGLLEKVDYFLDRGADVTVVAADLRALHPSLKRYTIRQKPNDTNGRGFQALLQADLVSVEFSEYYPLLRLLPLVADGTRKIIFDYHGVTPPEHSSGPQRESLLRGAEWAGLAGFADGVIVHSDFAARELSESIKLPRERVQRIGLPIDEQWFTPGEPQQSLRKRLGVGESRILLFAGRLAENKRVPILISALSHLRDANPPFHVAIVGPCGEVYEAERLRCRELAADLGVADRVHFLGAVDEVTLRDCYRSADALVIPSLHEGFCLPVIEAMACGLPVITSRAAALPETVGDTGLTFSTEDPRSLADRIHRLVKAPAPIANNRVALVTSAYGDVASGAERSLAMMAATLQRSGYEVHVFTTQLARAPAYVTRVKEFAANPQNPERGAAALNCAPVHGEKEAGYWQNTLRSDALLADLAKTGAWDAILVGPATTGLTRDVVRQFNSRVLLVPCLHDEPAARLSGIGELFEQVGGVVFHSIEERDLAASLGYNHPNSLVIGACINPSQKNIGNASSVVDRPYVVSIGRRVAEKNLPLLCEWAQKYHAEFAERFRFAFIGEGPMPIPDEPWAVDLGRLPDDEKDRVVANAAAIVQLSVNESLSLVVLEAQAFGVPVVVNAASPVLASHVERGNGGLAVSDYAQFAMALNHLWDNPDAGAALGCAGQQYVARHFRKPEAILHSLETAIDNLNRPMSAIMRDAGIRRAAQFSRTNWRRKFDLVVERLLDRPSISRPANVELDSVEREVVSPTWRLILRHRGGAPLVPTGPGRTEILIRCRDSNDEFVGEITPIALWKTITEGDEIVVSVPVTNARPGVSLEAGLRTYRLENEEINWFGPLAIVRDFRGEVALNIKRLPARGLPALAQLPDDYVDVSEGRLARWKRWIKSKLLHNFKVSYVDVVTRQQTRFNRRLLEIIEELEARPDDSLLRAELAESRRTCEELGRRVARLEATVTPARREAS